jgi:hypothetical protein
LERRTRWLVLIDDPGGPAHGTRLDEARTVDVTPTAPRRLGPVVDSSWDLDGAAIPRQ